MSVTAGSVCLCVCGKGISVCGITVINDDQRDRLCSHAVTHTRLEVCVGECYCVLEHQMTAHLPC